MGTGDNLFDHDKDGKLDFGERMERDYVINEESTDRKPAKPMYKSSSSYNKRQVLSTDPKATEKKYGFETVDGIAAGATFLVMGIFLMCHFFPVIGFLFCLLGGAFLITKR